ncbi:FAD/NAD(P)-binding protein [Kibdelosporangium lantanae]
MVFEHVRQNLPPNVTVTVHQATATSVAGDDGPQEITLTTGTLTVDLVLFALGHLDSEPDPTAAELGRYAAEHGLFYLPPAYSADTDLSGIEPGQDVLMRGFGLAFVDLMVLLTEGRGGKYRTEPDGTLTYLPSGEEPRMFVGSRRGVPYHSKTNYRLRADRPPLPRFFGPDAVAELAARDHLVFRTDVWPVMAKEIAWGHFHELFHGHPERVRLPWPDFADRYSDLTWGTTEMADLVNTAVPSVEDRIDFDAIDHPLRDLRFDTFADLQDHLETLVRNDIDRRQNDEYSHDLGAFVALLSVYGNFSQLVAKRPWLVRVVHEWWHGFFSFLASGPPGHRLEELLALSRAGIVRFVGADMRVTTRDGRFTATSPSSPHTVTATALVDARLPRTTLTHTANVLLKDLYETGAAAPEVLGTYETGRLVVTPADLHIVTRTGTPHPRRFAVGHPTNVVAAAAFSRPRTNAPSFRQNDLVAHAVLRRLSPERSTCGASVGGASPARTVRDAPGTAR